MKKTKNWIEILKVIGLMMKLPTMNCMTPLREKSSGIHKRLCFWK